MRGCAFTRSKLIARVRVRTVPGPFYTEIGCQIVLTYREMQTVTRLRTSFLCLLQGYWLLGSLEGYIWGQLNRNKLLEDFKKIICIICRVNFLPFHYHLNLLLLHQIRCCALRWMHREFFRFVSYSGWIFHLALLLLALHRVFGRGFSNYATCHRFKQV